MFSVIDLLFVSAFDTYDVQVTVHRDINSYNKIN